MRQEGIIALEQFNVRFSWLKIVNEAILWNVKFQKGCFSLSENLFISL